MSSPPLGAAPPPVPPPAPAVLVLPPPTPRSASSNSARGNALGEGIGIGAAIVLVCVLGIFVFCLWNRRRKKRDGVADDPITELAEGDPSHQGQRQPATPRPSNSRLSSVQRNPSHHRQRAAKPRPSNLRSSSVNRVTIQDHLGLAETSFTYLELALATNSFDDTNFLGEGGFGSVHKGVLSDGKLVAIKQLKDGSHQGESEFQAEVETIGRVNHKHLVSLVGHCISGHQRLLIYEYVPNGSLEFHLYGNHPLDWATRMKIALGSAKGLAYLHEETQPMIIHRDIKSANILLDEDFEAKLADFGLARSKSATDTHVSTRVMGTFGYLAPEYARTGMLTDKSDVFSYGVVLLELITGRQPLDKSQTDQLDDNLIDWARPLLEQAVEDGNFDRFVDPRLQKNYDSVEMTRMAACAFVCVRHHARRRPRMSQIVSALEGNLPVDELTKVTRSGSHGSSDYDAPYNTYKEDLAKFKEKMAMESTEHSTSGCSGPSEFGRQPSSPAVKP